MSRATGRDRFAVRLVSWMASAGLHVAGIWAAVLVWPFIWLAFYFLGVPSDDRYAFRWDNPYYRGGSPDEDDSEDGPTILMSPRPPRALPEMAKPRDHGERIWDSRRIPFDEVLGEPSPFERRSEPPESPVFHLAIGVDFDFVSDKVFSGKGTYDQLGVAGGGGGRYGARIVLKDAVQLGLLWLARHQQKNGIWSAASLGSRCGRSLPNGREIRGPACGSDPTGGDDGLLTALALLAFAAAGYRPDSPDVWDGIRYRAISARACLALFRPSAENRAPTLLALCASRRPPSVFDPPGQRSDLPPDVGVLEKLLASLESDPRPEAGSEAAAWTALAFLNAARAGIEVGPQALEWTVEELERRRTAPAMQAGDWPGEDLEASYLRLLGSYQDSLGGGAVLPDREALYERLRAGQCRDKDACREGSWEPVEGRGRLATTIFHILALQTMPGYGFRGGHPLRPSPEVLAREAMLRKLLQEKLDRVRAIPGGLRGAITRVREERRLRGGATLEERVRAEFAPAELAYVRHVREVAIGDHLESDNDEEFGLFKPLSRLGGNKDLLTEEVHEGLSRGDGIVGFDAEGTLVVPGAEDDLTSLGRALIFTLPDAGGEWGEYVVIAYPFDF